MITDLKSYTQVMGEPQLKSQCYCPLLRVHPCSLYPSTKQHPSHSPPSTSPHIAHSELPRAALVMLEGHHLLSDHERPLSRLHGTTALSHINCEVPSSSECGSWRAVLSLPFGFVLWRS